MKLLNRHLLRAIFLMKGDFAQGRSPVQKVVDGVEIAPYLGNAAAAVNLSADFELNWAWRGRNPEVRDALGSRERRNVPALLRLFEEFDFPISWATVGHLFLSGCHRDAAGLAHAEMLRPKRNFGWRGDWYVHDPCTDAEADPLWYAPDLVRMIQESPVPHELCTHSFSHIEFSPAAVDAELVRQEIDASISAMKTHGIVPDTLVFPFNIMGDEFFSVLHERGIRAVRYRDKGIRLSYPEMTSEGVLKIYESMNLRRPKYYDYARKAAIFLAEAMKRKAVYHLWFHPSEEPDILAVELRQIVSHMVTLRSRGDVWVATMSELAAYCRARASLILEVTRKKSELSIEMRSGGGGASVSSSAISLVLLRDGLPRRAVCVVDGRDRELRAGDVMEREGKVVITVLPGATSLRLMY